ncbi:MAG: hypothetical protein SFU84_06810 [Gemmatimonadales bacterium]|nr:hypothetical protein [Gemmatimonadales bacterium]
MSLALLRQQLQEMVPVAPASPGLRPGVPGGERVLPAGVPRGRLTALEAALGAGSATVLHALVSAALADGHAVAYVDAGCTLHPRDWAPLAAAAAERFRVVRATRERGAWCADVLLRSAAFQLVVLDLAGSPEPWPIPRPVAMRLAGLARETDTAFVVAGQAGTVRVGVAVRLRVELAEAGGGVMGAAGVGHGSWRGRGGGGAAGRTGAAQVDPVRPCPRHDHSHSVEVPDPPTLPAPDAPLLRLVTTHATVEFPRAIRLARRLCAHPEVPDRRGVASGAGGRTGGRADGGTGHGRSSASDAQSAHPPVRQSASGVGHHPHRTRDRAASPRGFAGRGGARGAGGDGRRRGAGARRRARDPAVG